MQGKNPANGKITRLILMLFACHRKTIPQGSILIIVILIMSTLSVFGGLLLGMVYDRFLNYELEADRAKALYIAEAGVSYSIWELKMNKDIEGNGFGNIQKYDFGGGYFTVNHNPETREIVSMGVFNDVRRTVSIIYESN
jgi:hypothetical protein